MRVQHIKIEQWRHFQNIEINIPDNSPIVCLIGSNGTGKSHVLELIAACAMRIGISPGFESLRGNPLDEDATFEVKFYIEQDAIESLENDIRDNREPFPGVWKSWDRTLTVYKKIHLSQGVIAGGISSDHAENVANAIVKIIKSSQSVHYLMLDGDRAYPKITVQVHELGAAFQNDWEGQKKARSFVATRSLYEEWFRYLLGRENKINNQHAADIRRARDEGGSDPVYVDTLKSYKDAVQKVLPHLLFTGINSQSFQVNFDSTGIPLTFDDLSGGEREIAFLIGQIERFGLRRGLMLVDEPELHLNYDLLRSWIGFLRDSVEQGQIWLATHSLEVVEVTGQQSTFLLERDPSTRRVNKAACLKSKPIINTLSRSVGSPAFSVPNLTFILIEGEAEIGERERFRLLTNFQSDVRFMEGGGCSEVSRKLGTLRMLAEASGEKLKLGGVLDRDWREASEREEFEKIGLFVLETHEIENLFLHPPTVEYLLKQISGDYRGYSIALRAASDRRAGMWIFESARSHKKFSKYPRPSEQTKKRVHDLCWSSFQEVEKICREVVETESDLEPSQQEELYKILLVRTKIYERRRQDEDLWKICEGKEVFRSMVGNLGFSDAQTAERAIVGVWKNDQSLMPAELTSLRTYIDGIRSA